MLKALLGATHVGRDGTSEIQEHVEECRVPLRFDPRKKPKVKVVKGLLEDPRKVLLSHIPKKDRVEFIPWRRGR